MKNETAIFILLKSLTNHAFHPSRYFLLSSLLLDLSLRRVIVVHTLGLSLGPRETHRKRGHELSFSDPFNFPFHWNQRLALPPFVEEHSNHCCDTLSIWIIFIVRFGRVQLCRCEPFTCLELPPFVDASKSSVSNSCRKVNNFKAAFVIVY